MLNNFGFKIIRILNINLNHFIFISQTGTYSGRKRRQVSDDVDDVEYSLSSVNVNMAERQILKELGPKACIMEEPCRIHANRKAKSGEQPEWNDILK